jgi:branched-chain amino acid transport system permease protein
MSRRAADAPSRPVRWPAFLGALVVIALLPMVVGTQYWRGILVVCAMNVLLAMSLNLVIGYTGQLSLGQSGFFAIGAYVTTVLLKSYGWNFWLAGAAAVLAAGSGRASAGRVRGAPARPLSWYRLARFCR